MKNDDIIPLAQAKVSRKFIHELARLTGLSKRDLAWCIGLTERALYKTPNGDFSVLISEHLLLLRTLFQEGLAVFDQNKKALAQWLKTPLPELAFPELSQLAPNPPALNETMANQTADQVGNAKPQDRQPPLITPYSNPEARSYPTPFSLLNTNTGLVLVEVALTNRQAGATLE